MEKTYFMNLNEDPFRLILNEKKTIEMRLNKGERKNIKSGDYIIFSHSLDDTKLKVQVLSVSGFNSFKELHEHFPKEKLGYEPHEIASYQDMNLYYSDDDIKAYGVLGIEIKLLEIIK